VIQYELRTLQVKICHWAYFLLALLPRLKLQINPTKHPTGEPTITPSESPTMSPTQVSRQHVQLCGVHVPWIFLINYSSHLCSFLYVVSDGVTNIYHAPTNNFAYNITNASHGGTYTSECSRQSVRLCGFHVP